MFCCVVTVWEPRGPETEDSGRFTVMEARVKEMLMDYSPWQRTKVKEAKSVTQKSIFLRTGNLLPPMSTPEVGKGRKKIFISNQKEKEEESDFSYPRAVLTLGTWSLVQDDTSQKATERDGTKRDKNCKILQILIKCKKLDLVELEAHCARLLDVNRSLAESIKQMDSRSFMYAREVLEQYQMTEKSTISMQEWNQREVKMARQDLKEAEEMGEKQLAELQGQLHELDSKLQASKEELRILRAYKDNEFPGKVLRIAQLQRELHQLKEAQQVEKADLEVMQNTEVDNVLMMQKDKDAVLENTIEKAKMKHFPVSLMQMAAFNHVMRKEIQLHKQIIQELKKEVSDLLQQQLLLFESRREVRQGIFADVLLQRPKCTPDMEVVLNTPLQENIII